ncbi:protein SHORTAGE IN CHIASMATA 1 isoform X2 [Arachis ipaensis]|nr:protein SHORTAGE IN CHIASMATA 1 isoform X2 [Arachis ipaensis]
MRTRFLNNDYFALPPSQRFLHLPVPRLHAPPTSAVHILRFDSTLPVSHHIEPLAIAGALSTFLSSVLPHKIHLELLDLKDPAAVPSPPRDRDRSSSFSCGSYEDRNPQQEAETSFEEDGRQSCRNVCSEADTEFPKETKRIDCSDKSTNAYKVIQFETPELDALLNTGCFTEREWVQMLDQMPEVENCLEMFKPEPSMQFPYEALEAVPRAENAISEYLKVEDAYSFEDNISARHPSHSGQNMFLNLEVDEESLGIPSCLSLIEILGTYFDFTKSLNFDEECQSITDDKSMSYNMVKLFSDECTSKQSLVLSPMSPESDLINMLETEYFGSLEGTSQADLNLFMNLVTFQEFVFLDEDFTQTIEAFYHKSSSDILESTNWMFEKEFNLKNFDELIVSNEMALMDDKFKSLPVPVISDYKKLIALHDIIQELFSNLKTRPLSASDGIYLNWDLLEEDECNYKISSWHQNIWAKIDLKNQGFIEKFCEDGKSVFDLVLSEDTTDDHDNNQSEELQKLLSDNMSLLDISLTEFASVKQLERGSSTKESQEPLPEKGAERASRLFKSVSEISSLDYFLNPQKATISRECNFAVESTDANARVPEFTPANIEFSRVAAEADDFVPLIAALKTDHGHQGMELFTGSVIIVNTQNVDKEMIFSRRSSYQVILGMEKGGIQVVERDLDLPVDIILSSAICLAWYDSTNLAMKATPVTEASSSLHLYIENIAADVLTMLSFYFRGCFLVFEGEYNFLSTLKKMTEEQPQTSVESQKPSSDDPSPAATTEAPSHEEHVHEASKDVAEEKSVIPDTKPDESKALVLVEKPLVEEKPSEGSVDRDAVLARVATEKRLSLVKAWEESEKSKAENKAHKKLSAISAWENSKKASVEAELKKIEEQLEKKKAEYAEKIKNKIAAIHKEAEEKRAIIEAKKGEDLLKAEEVAAKYRATGTAPKKLLGCF